MTRPIDHSPRKQPTQERSRRMRSRILEASLRVLQQEGALGFTTTRVADEAGISVGSLYQYFPNKHALVFALHDDDIERGWEHIRAVLDRTELSPRQKLSEVTRWFFATEAEEVAQLGAAIGDIELFLRDRAATRDILPRAIARFVAFINESSATQRTRSEARFDAHLAMTTIESVGKTVASFRLTTRENQRWADATAAMVSDYLDLHQL
jgi:AcrR family transcriptional regulator